MEKNKNLKEIVIKVEGEKWEKALDKAFQKANAKAKIDGFRPGKAPKNIFLNIFYYFNNIIYINHFFIIQKRF
mgnify:CR=1 FL=1